MIRAVTSRPLGWTRRSTVDAQVTLRVADDTEVVPPERTSVHGAVFEPSLILWGAGMRLHRAGAHIQFRHMASTTTPEQIVQRILRISVINGWCVTVAAGLGALVSLAMMDPIAGLTGAMVAVGGITELRGRKALLRGDATGMRKLFLAQLIVLAMIWTYAVTQLLTFDATALVAALPEEIFAMIEEAGLDSDTLRRMIRIIHTATYGVLILATLIYQGGLALYYRHRTPLVAAVLSGRPPVMP